MKKIQFEEFYKKFMKKKRYKMYYVKPFRNYTGEKPKCIFTSNYVNKLTYIIDNNKILSLIVPENENFQKYFKEIRNLTNTTVTIILIENVYDEKESAIIYENNDIQRVQKGSKGKS